MGTKLHVIGDKLLPRGPLEVAIELRQSAEHAKMLEGLQLLIDPENRLLIVINRTDRNFIDIDLQRFR